MDKGGKGFSLPSSKGLKSSLKTTSGSLGKEGKGNKNASGFKMPVAQEPPPLGLKLEQELPKDAKCLMDCEAALILQGIQEQMVLLSRDPTIKLPMSFDKGLHYAKAGARYTNPQSVRRALEYP
uniref:Uncharacterized protein MANES_09G085000 n=1 Tax=Rhizophora mucronata TaxID=61149 RepID=A0A2P2JLW1_RHIMU